jgi:hypothetical protein
MRGLGIAENDSPELQEKRWRHKTNNREEWAFVVKEAKVCRSYPCNRQWRPIRL